MPEKSRAVRQGAPYARWAAIESNIHAERRNDGKASLHGGRMSAMAEVRIDDHHHDAAFAHFVSRFHAKAKAHGSLGTNIGDDLNAIIAALDDREPGAVERMIEETRIEIFGPALPETRVGDRVFAYTNFVICHRRPPNDGPLFNDVLHRMLIGDEILDPLRVFVSDKEFVKLYVAAVVGERYAVPTIDVIREAAAVADYPFPHECCIKPTQASGEVILRQRGEPIDREKIADWFGLNYYRLYREANYKRLTPKVIVEPILFGNTNLDDYRIFCYRGKPKLIHLGFDLRGNLTKLLLTPDWRIQDFSMGYPQSERRPPPPENLEEMLQIAGKLSARFDFIRVDFYTNGQRCYVGEITNCHSAAMQSFIPASAEALATELIFG
jgi:hypothetical protein